MVLWATAYPDQPAVHTCDVCVSRFCGEHLLRAYFSCPGMPAVLVFDVCQQCLEQVIHQQHLMGHELEPLV